MILAIDGRPVGGMTEHGLWLKLQFDLPVLLLVVSRYRHAAEAEEQIRQAEGLYWEAIDKALNDNRRLGWVDIELGPGGSTDDVETTDAPGTSPHCGFSATEDGNASDDALH